MNRRIFLLFSLILTAFLSINSKVYADDSNINFPINSDENTYQQYEDESDVYYKHGMDYLKSNQYSQAIDSFERALAIAPERENTRINLAVAYINRGSYFVNQLKDTTKAANDYRNAIYLLKYDGAVKYSDIVTENLGIAKLNLEGILKNANISTSKASRLRIAKELRGQGKFREALVEFNEALDGTQSDLPVVTAIGDMYSALQNDKNAVKYYQKAVAYNVGNVDLHLKLANSLYSTSDVENAVKEYNIALNTSKDENKAEVLKKLEEIWIKKLQDNSQDAVAHMNLGVIFQKEGRYDDALNEYQIAESINPNDVTTRLNIGTLFQAKKDYPTAINAYDTILQVNPENMLAHYYKGKALKESGQLDAAVHEFQIVLNKDPDNVNAKEELFDTIKMFPNTQESADIFRIFAENNPTDALAQFQYGLNLHTNGQLDDALTYYKKAIAINPKFMEAYLNIANIYKQKNQTSSAVADLQSGLKALPNNKKLKDLLVSLSAENVDSQYQDALKKHKEGKYAEAIKEYLAVIQVSQPDSDLYVNLGAAYQAYKNLPAAANAYKKAIEINGKNSTAYYYLGTVYTAQGKNLDAANAYKKALALDTSNDDIKQALKDAQQSVADSALQKGINEYNKAQYQQALLTFNTLSIKDPNNAYVYYYRGMVYDALKKYQLAIADYKLTLKFKPDLNEVYYAVAVDYDTLKNYTEAKKWYTVFISNSSDKTDEYVKYARDRIKRI